MTLVVTGAAGVLGGAAPGPDDARRRSSRCTAPGSNGRGRDGVRWVAQDLTQPLSGELPDHVDGVFHLAQSRRFREFPAGAVDVMEVNTMAAARLLDYCHRAGGRSFVFASTGAVTGAGPQAHQEATTTPRTCTRSPSTRANFSPHSIARSWPAHLRYFFIYGPGQQAMMMPGIIGRVKEAR